MPSRFSSRFALLALAALLAPACAPSQSEECVQYVACQRAVDRMTGSSSESVLAQYDADGDCWDDPIVAASCTAGCQAGVETAKSLFADTLPVECGGDFVVPDGGLPTDGGDSDAGPLPRTATVSVGAEGGTVAVEGATLEIPAGALAGDVAITVTATLEPAPGDVVGVAWTPLFRFEPEGLVFSAPVSVSFAVPAGAGGTEVAVYWSRLGASGYDLLGSGFAPEVTVATSHFSTAFLGAPPSAGDAGTSENPSISSFEPSTIEAGSPDTTLTVYGTGFSPSGHVALSGTPLETTVVSATEATAVVPAAFLYSGSYYVSFYNDALHSSAEQTILTVVVTPRGDELHQHDANVGRIAADESHVYFAVEPSVSGAQDAALYKLPHAGGAPTLLAQDLGQPGDVAVDGTHVFFAANGTLMRVGKDGSGLGPLGGVSGVGSLRVDGGYVYYVGVNGSVARVRTDGSGAETLASGLGTTYVMGLDDTHVYVADRAGARIQRVARDGSGSEGIYSFEQNVNGLTAFGGTLYWTANGTGLTGPSVRAGPTTGGTAVDVSGTGFNPGRIETDGARLYWITSEAVLSTSMDGSDLVYLGGAQGYPTSLALTSDRVFWATRGAEGNKLLSAPKPGGAVVSDGGVLDDGGLVDSGLADAGLLDGGAAPNDGGLPGDAGAASDGGAGPILYSIAPDSAAVGSGPIEVTLVGANLDPAGSAVIFGDLALATTWIDATRATAIIPAEQLTFPTVADFGWFSGGAGFERSNYLPFTIYDPNAADAGVAGDAGAVDGGVASNLFPSPVLNQLSSTEVRQGTNDLPIEVYFDTAASPTPDTVIRVNGVDVTSELTTMSSVGALIPASFFTTAGTLDVTAYTPYGGLSNALTITVVANGNGAPAVSYASPAAVAQGTSTQVLVNAHGSGFLSGAKCFVGLRSVQISNQNATVHGCVLYAQNLLMAGDFPIRIVNPGPGGGASLPVSFSVNGTNPVPSLATATPAELGTGTADIYVELTGDGLLPLTRIDATVGGVTVPLKVRRYNATSGNVLVPATLLTQAGPITLTPSNPAPGGGVGTSTTIEVLAGNPTPQLGTVQPFSLSQGVTGQQLTLNGSGFGGETFVEELTTSTGMAPTLISSTELTVTVPDALVANAGTLQVRVVNPAPGGGASAQRPVVVNTPLQIFELDPASVSAGSGDFTLTVYGDGLDQEGYRVLFVGAAAFEPAVVTASYWQVTVPASVVAAPGSLDVRALIEGKGESNALTLTVTP